MSSNLPNPNCNKCFGSGERHNGYFSYPCNCSNPLTNIAISNKDFEKVFSENYEIKELKKEITIRKQYESFLISVIRSGESLSEEKDFEWFKEWFKRQLK